mgnify:FL=1
MASLRSALRTSALHGLVLLSALITLPGTAAELDIELTNPPAEGPLYVLLFEDADTFGSLRTAQYRERFDAGQPIRLSVPEGDYAVLLFVDENGNGELDRNFIGIPREPIALSNNYRPKGPPNFNRARLTLSDDAPTQQTLSLSQILGDTGQWGIGIGAVGQTSPYRGSTKQPGTVIPAIVYIGEKLQWTGPRIRYTLAGSTDWRLAVQGDLRLGAYEEQDSPFLAGMGDRDTTLMLGLAWTRELPAGIDFTVSASQDLFDRSGGQQAELSLSRGFQWGNWRLSPFVGLNWLSADLADYEFGVPTQAATAERPAYQPSSAVNPEAGVTFFYEITQGWQMVGNIGVEQLGNELTDSPIVDEERLMKGFVSLTYTF